MSDKNRLTGKGKNLGAAAKSAADAAKGAAGDAAGAAKGAVGGTAGAVGGLAGGATDAAKGAVGGAASLGKGAVGSAGSLGKGAVGAAAGGLGGLASSAKGVGSGVGSGAASLAGRGGKGGGRSGWKSFVPPNKKGKFRGKWPWLGALGFLGLCGICGGMAWDQMEDGLDERAMAHLECEGIDTSELALDWKYRDVDVTGQIPVGVTANQIEQVIDKGSSNEQCLAEADIDADGDPGVYDVRVAAAAAAVAVAVPDPDPTATPAPAPTATPAPAPTATPEPEPTATSVPEPTAAPQIAALAAAAAFDGQTITLTGDVGSEDQRAALVAAAIAQVGEDNVIDELVLLDGVPSDTAGDRIAELSAAIGTFGGPNVVSGIASVDEDAMTYQLRAPSLEAKAALELAGSGTVDVEASPEPSFTG